MFPADDSTHKGGQDGSDEEPERELLLPAVPTPSHLPTTVDAPSRHLPANNNTAAAVEDTVSFGMQYYMPTDLRAVYFHQQNHYYDKMIDNSCVNYVRIRLRCGVLTMCRTNVLAVCPGILQCLHHDLKQCLAILPPSVHALITQRTKIWINLSFTYGLRDRPRLLRHTTAHHDVAWLLSARDRPDKVHSIEIYDCREYLRQRLHWNGAGLLLHELCHLIHQHCLVDGLTNAQVLRGYAVAKSSGRYDNVLRRDWAGCDDNTDDGNDNNEGVGGERDTAYAMIDPKEWFAEMSVTYLANGYSTAELDDDDGTSSTVESCSPPIIALKVLERVHKQQQKRLRMALVSEVGGMPLGIPGRQLSKSSSATKETMTKTTEDTEGLLRCCCPPKSLMRRFLRLLLQCFSGPKKISPTSSLPHCNKFYPFTSEQLKRHDSHTYCVMRDLWSQVELWEDPLDDQCCRTATTTTKRGCCRFSPALLLTPGRPNSKFVPSSS